MKINKVYFKNFFKYGPNEQCIDLTGNGISTVCGDNGNGKSVTLIDSILFAFYAKYRTPKIDDVVNWDIGKDCKVSVEFEEDGEEYKVIRYRKHSVHGNDVLLFKGENNLTCKTSKETNQKILDIIKMPYVAFTNSSVFSTELYSGFLSYENSDRLNVFENILSLKEVTIFYEKTKDIIKSIKKELEEINNKYTSTNAEINLLTENITSYSNAAKEKLLNLKKEKEDYKEKRKVAEGNLNVYKNIDVDLEKSKLINSKLIEEYKVQINTKNSEKKSLKLEEPKEEFSILNKYKDIDFYSNKMKELKYKEDIETMKARENGYNISMQKISSFSEKESSLIKEKSISESKIIEINKNVESLLTSTCPFCGQKMHNAELKIKELEEQKRKIEADILEINKELDDVKLSLKEERETYNYLIADYNKIKENLDKNFISNSDIVEQQFNNAKKIVEDYMLKKNSNLSRVNEIDKEIEEIMDKMNSVETTKYTEFELNNISEEIERQKKFIEEYDKEINAIDKSAKTVFDVNYVNSLKKTLDCKKEETEKIMEEKSIKENDLLHYEYLQECFSNKSGGFKKHFIGEMIGYFNNKVNQYLPFFFSEDIEIYFDKDLNEKIIIEKHDASFKSFSQGQRQRTELAISFALFDVARTFFSNDNKLLILDEVDKGLDIHGIKAMINLLKGFDKQLRIFVVSHNPLLSDEIDDKIKIIRDENGFSVIKQ